MKNVEKQKYLLWEPGEYHYAKAGAFVPFIMAAIHEDEEIRPAMIVAPGGAYAILQPTEADFQARKYFERGYNTFVLCYTNNVTLDSPVGMQPLKDISRAVQFIRKNHKQFQIDVKRVYASGYSAGGHLALSLAVHHEDPILHPADAYQNISNRPDAVIPHYAAVSEIYGREIFRAMVTGMDAGEEELSYMSVEKHVTKNTSPMFILHGAADAICSPQNALMLSSACVEQGVDHEIHLIQNGNHGVTNHDSDPMDAVSSFYVYEQLYEAVHVMSEKEFENYRSLYGSLSREMSREEFYQEVYQNVMNHLFEMALSSSSGQVDREAIVNIQKGLPESVNLWREMLDAWLKVINLE